MTECNYETTDKGLFFAFAERRHHRTNTFHLTIGEMIITLNDVSLLLHIPIVGGFYSYLHTSKEVAITLLMELLRADKDVFLDMKQCRGGHVCLAWF